MSKSNLPLGWPLSRMSVLEALSHLSRDASTSLHKEAVRKLEHAVKSGMQPQEQKPVSAAERGRIKEYVERVLGLPVRKSWAALYSSALYFGEMTAMLPLDSNTDFNILLSTLSSRVGKPVAEHGPNFYSYIYTIEDETSERFGFVQLMQAKDNTDFYAVRLITDWLPPATKLEKPAVEVEKEVITDNHSSMFSTPDVKMLEKLKLDS